MKKSEVRKEGVRSQESVDSRRNTSVGVGPTGKPKSSCDSDSCLLTPDSSLIIGYGNPLRSDDAFGWHASRLLAEALAGKDVEVITCHQLTPELAEPLSQCRRAVFIDADAEGEPGEIHRRSIRPEVPASSSFTHTCTPSGLLASAQQLYGRRPQAIAITVTAQSFEFGDALSPVVSAALHKVVELVCQWVGVSRAKNATERRGAGTRRTGE